jgi:hypothetical protein
MRSRAQTSCASLKKKKEKAIGESEGSGRRVGEGGLRGQMRRNVIAVFHNII